MHPAASIIFFTTASGLGYGLLIWAGAFAAVGLLPPHRALGVTVMGLGLVLVSAGLLSSMLHLGRPERAWRAFSQWRSSWLSREGVMAVITFIPAGLFALGWVIFLRIDGLWALSGLAAAVCALVTTYCTAMIYGSLAPIRQWSNWTTVPAYLGFALMSGAVWMHALTLLFAIDTPLSRLITGGIAIVAIPVVYMVKRAAWHIADNDTGSPTAADATGLQGTVRSVEWPHTEENFLLKEMGYRIARKHAAKLRVIAVGTAFVIPEVLLVAALVERSLLATAAVTAAALIMMLGIAVERWLFFAEAKHTVTLYYGR